MVNLIDQKLLLSIFKSLRAYSKYAIEMFVSVTYIECMATEKLSEEIKWDFFSNRYGGLGNNIKNDFVQKIFNNISKNAVKQMGVNKTISAIYRLSRAQVE